MFHEEEPEDFCNVPGERIEGISRLDLIRGEKGITDIITERFQNKRRYGIRSERPFTLKVMITLAATVILIGRSL